MDMFTLCFWSFSSHYSSGLFCPALLACIYGNGNWVKRICRMLSHNLTTIEFCENRDIADTENFYSDYYTTASENYHAVLGKSAWVYFLPISTIYV